MVEYSVLSIKQLYITKHRNINRLLDAYKNESKLTEHEFVIVVLDKNTHKGVTLLSSQLGCDPSRVEINKILPSWFNNKESTSDKSDKEINKY